MKTLHVIILTAFAAVVAAASPLLAQEGRMLRTMPHGEYECALPGDAAREAYRVVPQASFGIAAASRYRTAEGVGTYLMRGEELVFTGGPRKGEQFRRVGPNQLQRLKEDGSVSKLLCTRRGQTG
jgi:hypothetical protein